jgi:proline iminopeptidase
VARRLTSEDEAVRLAAARQWTRWEMATSRLFPDLSTIAKADDDKYGGGGQLPWM